MKFSEPSFCFIVPTAYLEEFAIYSTTHLVLAHLVDRDPEYAAFYKRRGDAGDFIICDNSAYELKEPFAPEKLIELAKQSGASAIVLPDYPFQHSEVTIDAAKQFASQFKDAGFATMFVPQSERGDLEDWISAYTWAAENDDIDIIGMSILGIPNALPHIPPAYARVVMSELLMDRDVFNNNKHHHYLGLNAGPALEIPSLIQSGALDTVDSSGPFMAALCGHAYTIDSDSYQAVKKIKMPVDFAQHRTKDRETLDRLHHNFTMTHDMMLYSGEENDSTWYAEE